MRLPDARLVLAIGHVETPMAAILDPPVAANGMSEQLHTRSQPRLGLVLPVVLLPLRLGDVGPRVPLLAFGQRLGFMVALVRHRLLDLLFAVGQHQVDLSPQNAVYHPHGGPPGTWVVEAWRGGVRYWEAARS